MTESTPVFITAATADWYQVKTMYGKTGFISQNLLRDPNSQPMSEVFSSVIPSLQNIRDNLLVDLGDFNKIGELGSFEVISDGDENIYIKPKQ